MSDNTQVADDADPAVLPAPAPPPAPGSAVVLNVVPRMQDYPHNRSVVLWYPQDSVGVDIEDKSAHAVKFEMDGALDLDDVRAGPVGYVRQNDGEIGKVTNATTTNAVTGCDVRGWIEADTEVSVTFDGTDLAVTP